MYITFEGEMKHCSDGRFRSNFFIILHLRYYYVFNIEFVSFNNQKKTFLLSSAYVTLNEQSEEVVR